MNQQIIRVLPTENVNYILGFKCEPETTRVPLYKKVNRRIEVRRKHIVCLF